MPTDTSSLFANSFSVVFVTLLLLGLIIKASLMRRQIGHVQAYRASVPPAFAASITLSSHQRAADYTVARMRLSLFEIVLSALFVLLLTLGGGLQLIHDAWTALFVPGSIAHGIALLASLGAGLLSVRRIARIDPATAAGAR